MARPKPTYCKNCGLGVQCDTFDRTGKACRKNKAKGKAIGKAKGKAISNKTKEKQTKNLNKLFFYHTAYLMHMMRREERIVIDEETGEIIKRYKEFSKPYSFERYLTLENQKTLASWFRKNFKDELNAFDYKAELADAQEETESEHAKRYFEKFMYREEEQGMALLDKQYRRLEKELKEDYKEFNDFLDVTGLRELSKQEISEMEKEYARKRKIRARD